MSPGEDLAGLDRIESLIEECRMEREACETLRERVEPAAPGRSIYAAVTRRLLAGVGRVHAAAPPPDPAGDAIALVGRAGEKP